MRRLLPALLVLLAACDEAAPPPHLHVAGGDAARGRAAMTELGCGACHRIPGVGNARAMVGPPLDDYAQRGYVAGVLPNRPGNLVSFLLDPPSIRPGTAMPYLGLTDGQARDMAAYLYTLGAPGAAAWPPGRQPSRSVGDGGPTERPPPRTAP
ncbi:c-type cytochrome [Roseomonas stagni]|uniref:C-type cytochrome n=1 Tax=Falsiroseomonas algicola TaxID=2716930 RepID=A0A6M1LID0_9PROT|nr:c-type cytochrome [Falsiroseomonas algicola]NGM20095.1 c-type cytochrome [Falsiroseomonas algicola]